jgi:hypothetical protein
MHGNAMQRYERPHCPMESAIILVDGQQVEPKFFVPFSHSNSNSNLFSYARNVNKAC